MRVRYGPTTTLRGAIVGLASFILLASLTNYVASQFQGAGKSFSETFHLSEPVSILIGAGIVLFYTLLGGFWAVSLTDALQGLVMAASSVALPIFALFQVGGPVELMDKVQALNLPGYQSLFENAAQSGGVGFVLGLLGIGLGYPGQPHVVNRFMALREGDKELRKARTIAMAWAVVVYSGMLILGWCGRALFPQAADAESIFFLVTNLLPPVLAGVMLAAVLAAIMSTADSQLLVAGSVITHDLKLGGTTARQMLLRSRIVVFLICSAAFLAALLVKKSIFNRVLSAWTAMGAAFGPLLLVTLIRGPVPPGRTLAAMISGFLLSVIFHSLAEAQTPVSVLVPYFGFLKNVFPYGVAFAVLLIASGKQNRVP